MRRATTRPQATARPSKRLHVVRDQVYDEAAGGQIVGAAGQIDVVDDLVVAVCEPVEQRPRVNHDREKGPRFTSGQRVCRRRGAVANVRHGCRPSRGVGDNGAMGLNFAGAAIDVAVSDLGRAERFYAVLVGRPSDLQPRPDQREWRLHPQPEIVLRLTVRPEAAGHGMVAIGVRDVGEERARLGLEWPDLPQVREKPGVIVLLPLADPDGNTVTLWQDLLGERRPLNPV